MGSNMELLDRGKGREAKQETYYKYPDTMARTKMIRTHQHKMVIRLRGGNEFYNLDYDPYEMYNIWGDSRYKDIIMDLQLQLLEWCLETDTDRPYQPVVGA